MALMPLAVPKKAVNGPAIQIPEGLCVLSLSDFLLNLSLP